jgi:large subunit ribosomal protein L20
MRVKTGTKRRNRHQKVLAQAKGFRLSRSRHYKSAQEAVLHAGDYAFAGRRLRKRDLRKLWIVRINAALKPFDLSYSRFLNRLTKAKIQLNRKMLANLAVIEPKVFAKIVKAVLPVFCFFFFQ